ncbi:ankyrin repeat-containing domain protein [Baffinella frigidus]|nr:ankyrin repeat-containing domain protein [Cryptophyta sp. CCMP2293]
MSPIQAKELLVVHRACAFGWVATLEHLLGAAGHCFNVNTRDSEGNTPLHVAVAAHNFPAVRVLLHHGADIAAVTGTGDTPMHIACDSSVQNATRLLWCPRLKYYTSNAQCMYESENDVRIVGLFLRHNIDYHSVDFDGWTALDKVKSNQNREIREMVYGDVKKRRLEAFLMAKVPRLGHKSGASDLNDDEIRMIGTYLGIQ